MTFDWWLILMALSLALGAAFVISGFGFASAWKQLIVEGKTLGVRLQLILLGLMSLVLYPLLDTNNIFSIEIQAFVRPLSLSVMIGGLLFGFGMQLAASCTSGSLGNAGRGHGNGWLTLLMMIMGATFAAYHFEWWQMQFSWLPVSLVVDWGWRFALGGILLMLGLLYLCLLWFEQQKHGRIIPIKLRSMTFGGVPVIALLLVLLTLHQGHPWGVTVPFANIGMQIMNALGVEQWEFWRFSAEYADLIATPLWREPMTMTLIGFILGAAVANKVLYRLSHDVVIKPPLKGRKNYLLAVIGGLLMGYAGIIGFGCNIGAFVSGFTTASMHSMLWLIFAFMGSWMGIKTRERVMKTS
jgi:hypothetical protein